MRVCYVVIPNPCGVFRMSAIRKNQSIIETTWELCRGVTTVVRHPDGTQIRVFSDGTHTETICVHPTSVRLDQLSDLSTTSGTYWTLRNVLTRSLCCRMERDAQVASLRA